MNEINDYTHFMEEYLPDDAEHHGIPRQRWGVRNGPPYPLDRETHNKVVSGGGVSASGAKYLRGRDLERAKAQKPGGVVSTRWKTGSQFLLSDLDNIWEDVEERVRRDNGQFVYYTAPEMIAAWLDEGKTVDTVPHQYHRNMPDGTIHKGLDNINLHYVNPDYGQEGTRQNCTKCTAALELLKRGWDVRAGGQIYPASADAFTYWFRGAKREDADYESTTKKLLSFGEGASGAICGSYPNNAGGHAIHFEVLNGSVHIRDGQSAWEASSVEEAWEHYGFDKQKPCEITRLDNCEPDWGAMHEDSVIKSSDRTVTKVRNALTGRIVDRW